MSLGKCQSIRHMPTRIGTPIFLGILLAFGLSMAPSQSQASGPLCSQVFSQAQPGALKPITDLKSFGQAMTRGMTLHPEQADIFEVYRKVFFGEPNTDVGGKTLKSVAEILKQHPELEKPHFQEFEISSVEKVYKTPESLAKYLKAQVQSAGQVRSNLFQIEANLDFWKKLLDYQDPSMPDHLKPLNLGKDSTEADRQRAREINKQRATFEEANRARFIKYLNRIINKTNRDLLADLKNENTTYTQKAKALFATLKDIQEWMDKKGRNTQTIRQAMVDLVYTIGYGNQATQALLKSNNALEKIEGLQKLWNEADALAEELKYPNHFAEVLEKLKIDFPTGLSKNENPTENIKKLEKEVLTAGFTSKPTDTIRVRSLSIQESPFRSCLGADCSTRTYFDKALDPNYIYFTMTDAEHHSSGHATLVLGIATDRSTGQQVKVAFLDKLQNIPNKKIEVFLDAISRSLATKGYQLTIPTYLGKDIPGHGGISNMNVITDFIQSNILPRLSQALAEFTPHEHQYNFPNKYSRGDKKLEVRPFVAKALDVQTEITPGKDYQLQLASKELSKEQLVQEFLKLKESTNEEDILRFIASSKLVDALEKQGLYSKREFTQALIEIIERNVTRFKIRKQALFSLLLLDKRHIELVFKDHFSDNELSQIAAEVKQWNNSADQHKKDLSTLVDYIEFSFLNKSTNDEDLLKYIASEKLMNTLESQGLYSRIVFLVHLQSIAQDKQKPFKVRKAAYLELLLSKQPYHKGLFSQNELKEISSNIKDWKKSTDERKKKYLERISQDFIEACKHGNLDAVQILIELVPDVNAKDKHGATALFLAYYGGHVEITNLLIVHGAEVNNTVYSQAVVLGHKEIGRLVLAYKLAQTLNGPEGVPHGNYNLNQLATMKLSPEELIMKFRALNSSKNEKDLLTIIASEEIYNDLYKIGILDNGRQYHSDLYHIYTNQQNPFTARKSAFLRLSLFTTEYLVRDFTLFSHEEIDQIISDLMDWKAKGVDKYEKLFKEIDYYFHKACGKGDLKLVKLLINLVSNINMISDFGSTPLDSAVQSGNRELVELLLTHNADVNEGSMYRGQFPIISAVTARDKPMVELLIAHHVDLNKKDWFGRSLLHLAIEWNAKEIIQLLLAHNTDIHAKDKNGNTALQRATKNGKNDIADLLRAHGAKE